MPGGGGAAAAGSGHSNGSGNGNGHSSPSHLHPPPVEWSDRRRHGHEGDSDDSSPSHMTALAPTSGPRRRSSSGCSASPPQSHQPHLVAISAAPASPASHSHSHSHANTFAHGYGHASAPIWAGGVRATIARVARMAAMQWRRSVRSLRAPPAASLHSSSSPQLNWLRATDGWVVPASRTQLRQVHGPRYQAPLVRLGDALLSLPIRWAVAAGAIAFLLLCFLPVWLPPVSVATLSSSSSLRNGFEAGGLTETSGAELQRPWDAAAAAAAATLPHRPTVLQMDRTLRLSRARLRLSPKHVVAEVLSRDVAPGTHDPAHKNEASKYLARHAPRALGVLEWILRPLLLPTPQTFHLTRSSVDTITLAYQKAAPVHVGPSVLAARPAPAAAAKQQHSLQLQLRPDSTQMHPLDAALAAANPSFASALAQTPSLSLGPAAGLNASARLHWEWNRHRWVEYQFTLRAWIPVEETRRLKLVRDYDSFPSPLPSFLSLAPLSRFDSSPPQAHADIPVPPPERLYAPERILLFYVFAYNHDEYMQNMETFIARAVRAHHPIDYIFFINQMEGRDVDMGRLPPLPPNARYVEHKNECMDWGTIGWFMQLQRELARDEAQASHNGGGWFGESDGDSALASLNKTLSKYHVDIAAYKYFLIMNSSVRGPWFPSYIDLDDPRNAWWAPLMQMLRRDPMVRMVGPLINCQISPHVQSYVLLLDQQAFALLRGVDADEPLPVVSRTSWWSSFSLPLPFSSWWARRSSSPFIAPPSPTPDDTGRPLSPVFTCHSSWSAAVNEAEVGSSIQLLKAGFNIGSMTRAFAGVDFRSNIAQECLGMELNPSQDVLAGSLVTSGPDASHVHAQIELLLAHHDRLLQAQHAREDEHDLEGDVLSEVELAARREAMRKRSEDLEGDDDSDWDWTPRSPSEEALSQSLWASPDGPSNQWIRQRRLDSDLDTQLRVVAAAKKVVLEGSMRRVAAEYAKQHRESVEAAAAAAAKAAANRAASKGGDAVTGGSSDSGSDLSTLVVPLLPASQRLHRARPEVLLRRGETYDAAVDGLGTAIAPATASSTNAGATVAATAPGADLGSLIDLDFLRRLTTEIRAFPYRSAQEQAEAAQTLRSIPNAADRPSSALPEHLQSDAPLSPSLQREKARMAQHRVDIETIYINPLEVVFGKWKRRLSMVDSVALDQYANAARDRRAHNRARKVHRGVAHWTERSRNRWARRWIHLPAVEEEEMRQRDAEQQARLKKAQRESAQAQAAAKANLSDAAAAPAVAETKPSGPATVEATPQVGAKSVP